jgi:autotransporter-associated beta strand protein
MRDNTRSSRYLQASALAVGLLLAALPGARAMIPGPYVEDVATLHLWHLDESALPAVDAAAGGTNLTVVGGTAALGSNSLSGFGKALYTGGSGTTSYCGPRAYANSATDNTRLTYADTSTGDFTMETLVRVDFNPGTNWPNNGANGMYLITGENQNAQDRPFQWALFPKGVASGATGDDTTQVRLRFLSGGSAAPNNIIVFVPSTGPDAIAQGMWFHVAVTYSGGVLSQYWTLMDGSRTQANLLAGPGGLTSQTMSTLNPLGIGAPCFMLGNQGRSLSGVSIGLLDEVRMSSVARPANGMMFSDATLAILTQPISRTIEVRTAATLAVRASGQVPLSFQWRKGGTPIAGATSSLYTLASAATTNSGDYTVVVTDATQNSITSDTAHLLVQYTKPAIVTQPVGDTVALGQPVSFSVVGSGTPPLTYQWRKNTVAISGATGTAYAIPAAQLGDAGTYDVVLSTDEPSSVTSDPAVLTVRTAHNLVWAGSGPLWDTGSVNWDSNGDLAPDAAYTEGDNVRFDDNGAAGAPVVGLSFCHPGSVVVANNIDYIFTPTDVIAGGGITRNGGLLKQGTGMLTFDVDNSYTGPTVIEAGTLTVGLAGNSTRGTLGNGPITNQALLLFDRAGTLTMTNSIAGSGELIKTNTLSLRLLASNTLSGPVTVKRGNLSVAAGGLGNATTLTLNGAGTGDGTSLTLTTNGLGQGPVLASSLTIYANTIDDNNRCGILNEAGTNIFNAALVLSGAGVMVVRPAAGAMEVNGPITGPAFVNNYITFRGGGTNILRSQLNLPNGSMQKDDAGTWLLTSSGNVFLKLRMLGAGGTLKLGTDNAVCPGAWIESDNGILDLAGFNQTVLGLSNDVAQAGTTVANSSTTRDSRLSLINSLPNTFGPSACILADSTAGGTRKVSLTVAIGGTQILTNVCTYSGDTTLTAGTLALTNKATLPNSTPISIAAGATLDVSARTNGTLTLGAAQVLKGDGAFNLVGSLVNNGTLEFKLNKAGATLSNDSIHGLAAVTYGGTLKLNVTASPGLSTSDSFKLFYATTYGGSFTQIVPSVPTFGLAWDTSTLATDGTLRLKNGPATNPTNLTAVVTGGGASLQLSWPADHQGWTLQVQTNAPGAGLGTNWVRITGSDATTSVTLPINHSTGSLFYRMVYP